jgi:hypothetical protein
MVSVDDEQMPETVLQHGSGRLHRVQLGCGHDGVPRHVVADGVDPTTATVADYMTWNAIVATSELDTVEAARTMLEHGFRHLLVIDGDHEVGILSIRDLMAGILGCSRPDRSRMSTAAGQGY